MKPLTRIAPTPSGFLHKGNAFNFMLVQKLAQHIGAEVLLRIDDLDADRIRPAYLSDIFSTLEGMGIAWHVGPRSAHEFAEHWSQRHRIPLYNKVLNDLVAANRVYACGCSRKQLLARKDPMTHHCRDSELPLDTPNVAWRFRLENSDFVNLRVFGHQIQCLCVAQFISDPVVRKRDGVAAYQVASLADDLHFGITHIVRGHDLLPSTLFQLLMANSINVEAFANIEFVHHPLLTDGQGAKLSKSAGADAFQTALTSEEKIETAIKELVAEVDRYQW